MEIGKFSLHTVKVAKKSNEMITNKLATNPFGVSFKGNVLQADVFENSRNEISVKNISEKSKLFASAVVSGINNFNEAFKSRMNSIVSFGKKVTSDALETIERIGNTEIHLNMDSIKNRLFPNRQYSVKNLSNRSVDELKIMWNDLTGMNEIMA